MKIANLDVEVLKTQDKLTEAQEEQIRENVFKEFQKEKEPEDKAGKGTPDEDTSDAEDEEDSESDSEGKEDDKAESEDEAGEEEESEDEEADKESEGKAKEPTDEEKKKSEEESAKEFEKQVNLYAEENSIGEAQARAELEHIGKIQEKYSKEPAKLAKAVLYLQRAFTKTQETLKQIQETPQEGELVFKGKKLSKEESKEKLVEMYREAYPQITEDLDDDKVYHLAFNEYKREYALFLDRQKKTTTEKASAKRQEVLNGLKEEDKPFLNDIKLILEKTEDSELLSEGFDPTDYLFWARGRNFHKILKEREDAAYKRGLEQKKILGVKPAGEEPKGATPKSKSSGLTEQDKERALAMYESLQITDKEKFDMYRDYKKVG